MGTAIPQAARVAACAIKSGFNMEAAKPTFQQTQHNRQVSWDDNFVNDLKIGLHTCRILQVFPHLAPCLQH